MAKVLALSRGTDDLGKYIATNADNLAQYSLAAWVYSKRHYYPHFPEIFGSIEPGVKPRPIKSGTIFINSDGVLIFNETALLSSIQSPLISSWEDLDETCDDLDDEGNCRLGPSTLNITSFANDTGITGSAFGQPGPSMTVSQVPVETGISVTPYVLPSDPNFWCTTDGNLLYQQCTSQTEAAKAIDSFCSNMNEQLSSSNTLYSRDYSISEFTTISLGAGWQVGDPACGLGRAAALGECSSQLWMVLANCDTASFTCKYGGHRVNDCVTWMMSVHGPGPSSSGSSGSSAEPTPSSIANPPAPSAASTSTSTSTSTVAPVATPLDDTCDVSYRWLYDLVEVRGKAWTTAELGADGGNLKVHLDHCGKITDWKFVLTPNDCCMDWKVSCHLPIGVKDCVGKAVIAAAGPGATVGDCHGAG